MYNKTPEPKNKIGILDIAIIGIASGLLVAAQVALSVLPNIELVSFLIILYALHLKEKTLYIIYVFATIQGVLYGFHIWWICYLYVWTLLYFVVRSFADMRSPVGWAVLSGGFGLLFGALCSIPYLFISGVTGMVSYFLAGIPFDIAHCVGNFIIALLLFKPVNYAFLQLMLRMD